MTILLCPKIGDGSKDNPFRPYTISTWWQVVEERETEFVIETLDDKLREG
jgi:hypothetical protein